MQIICFWRERQSRAEDECYQWPAASPAAHGTAHAHTTDASALPCFAQEGSAVSLIATRGHDGSRWQPPDGTPNQSSIEHEFHETFHSATFYFMKKDSKRCCDKKTIQELKIHFADDFEAFGYNTNI